MLLLLVFCKFLKPNRLSALINKSWYPWSDARDCLSRISTIYYSHNCPQASLTACWQTEAVDHVRIWVQHVQVSPRVTDTNKDAARVEVLCVCLWDKSPDLDKPAQRVKERRKAGLRQAVLVGQPEHRTSLGRPGSGWKDNIKIILHKYDGRARNGFVWLRTELSGRLLWMR